MQLLVNAAIAGSFLALMAGGLALVYGVLRVFNLSLGQFALVGGYVCWWFVRVHDFPLPLGIVLALAASILVSLVSFEIAIEPFYRRHRFLPLVTTIALSMILDALILLFFEEEPRSILPHAKHQLHFLSITISIEQLLLVALSICFLCSVAWLLHSTSLGRKIRATVEHSEAARALGIPSAVLHRVVFVFSGLLAAAGGIYLGIDQNLTPTLAFPVTIKAYAALIAGGKDSFWGTIAASYGIALLEQLAVGLPWWRGTYLPAGYQSAVALLVIILILLMKPQGIFGSRLRTA